MTTTTMFKPSLLKNPFSSATTKGRETLPTLLVSPRVVLLGSAARHNEPTKSRKTGAPYKREILICPRASCESARKAPFSIGSARGFRISPEARSGQAYGGNVIMGLASNAPVLQFSSYSRQTLPFSSFGLTHARVIG